MMVAMSNQVKGSGDKPVVATAPLKSKPVPRTPPGAHTPPTRMHHIPVSARRARVFVPRRGLPARYAAPSLASHPKVPTTTGDAPWARELVVLHVSRSRHPRVGITTPPDATALPSFGPATAKALG